MRYPFGYGLSYTTFGYGNMQVEETDGEYKVSCEVVNNGKYDGAEIVQLYVKSPQGVFKPVKELKGFAKVYLKAGESKTITITVNRDDLSYWNVKENCWTVENGEYELQLCSDCRTVRLSQAITIMDGNGEKPYSDEINDLYANLSFDKVTNAVFENMSGVTIPAIPPKKPIGLESRFTDMQQTFMGRILYNAVLGVAKKDMKKAKKLPAGAERDNKIKGAMFLKRILESNSIITMSMSAGKNCPYNFAQGFVNMANGHLFKGVKCFCTKIEVPQLPKEQEDK